jgi:hypothetical protein
MSKKHIEHIIEQTQARIEHEEAMAALLRSHAQHDKMMLDLLISQQNEIQRLKKQRHIINVTNQIESFSGNYFENIKHVKLCPPLSTTSMEHTSSTSTTMSKPKTTINTLNQ